MPSSVISQIVEIEDLCDHPDADRLSICVVAGWALVVGKGIYRNGDRVVFITPDSLISDELAEDLGIKQYLSAVKNSDGTFVTNDNGSQMWRVRQAKLRGVPSFGTTVSQDVAEKYGVDLSLPLGTNVAETLGIAKYEPHIRSTAGDCEVDHVLFPKYTNIENLRNFPKLFNEGEEVICTGKIHGTNCRVALIDGEFMAGSHGLRRKKPEDWEKNTYWFPLSLNSVKHMLSVLALSHRQVVLYGEIYGNVQKKYHYGVPNGIAFRAFDLLLDGKYVAWDTMVRICEEFGVETVLELGRVPYSFKAVVDLAESFEKDPLGDHPLEGVVIKPTAERHDARLGRTVLKYVTDVFLFDKGGSDFTDY